MSCKIIMRICIMNVPLVDPALLVTLPFTSLLGDVPLPVGVVPLSVGVVSLLLGDVPLFVGNVTPPVGDVTLLVGDVTLLVGGIPFPKYQFDILRMQTLEC